MTALLVENPATVTPWSAARALTEGPAQRAVLIVAARCPCRDADLCEAPTAQSGGRK